MPKTGLGATLTLTGASTFTARYKSISAPSFTVDALDDTALDNTAFYSSCADDLAKSAPITATYYCDLKADLPVVGATPTVTVTFPKQPNTTTAAKVVGTAIITRVDMPEMSAGTLLMGAIELTFDGKTGPAFTKGS